MNTTKVENSQANILIVDDSLENVDLLAASLKKQGYQTLYVDNGLQALEIACSGWADLILLDIQMPNMDGYQVCEQLKAETKTKDIPVIFISAEDNFADKKKAFQVGGIDCINKINEPLGINEVLVRIAAQMAIQSSKSEIIENNNRLEQKAQDCTAELERINQQLEAEINRRQQAQDRLLKISLQDPITGFANRNSFLSQLKQTLKFTEKYPNYFFAVILLECDRYKNIKRTLTHIECNQLLMAIAHTLQSCLPESTLLSRLEGEEFAILLDKIQDVNDATAIVTKIQQKLTYPFTINRRKFLINANIGIAIGNKDYQDTDRLFNDAYIAMHQAKEQQGDGYLIFQPDMYIQLQEDVELSRHEIALKQAIKQKEFINYYLPSTSLKNQRVIELEALVRWQHPQKGIILPQEFIPIAEEIGLMNSIGNLVLKQACKHIKGWQQNYKEQKNLGICLNLSAKQLFHPNLLNKVDWILRKSNLEGNHLKFDIPETVILENQDTSLKILQELKKRQVRLSLDNFGVGYSSLTCLHCFPFDDLKIDRSLIAHFGQENPNLKQEKSTTLLLEQIITIAHQMNIVVTATGIENTYQLNLLKDLGCDHGQGYLISKLLDENAVEKFLLWATGNIRLNS